MTKKEYEEAKKEIFDRASKRAEQIMKKYNNIEIHRNLEGVLDGDPCSAELRKDSKKTLQELEELDRKYNK